jgi:hypothetical protein
MLKGIAFLVCSAPLLGAVFMSPVQEQADPIATLIQQIKQGRKLPFHPKRGYLDALLKELNVSRTSQTLVFSKSSLQSDYISPGTPRAIYFNQEVYVGWIPGAPLIEIMSVDPMRGVQFYTLPNHAAEGPSFKTESSECFRCHGGRGGNRPAALFVQSSETAPSGYPRVFSRTLLVGPSTPLKERWGGWYVSGTHGKQRHRGNELSIGTDEKHYTDVDKGANVTDLRRYFDVNLYLTPHSDIAALMVMEHQMDVQNILSNTLIQTNRIVARNGPESEILDACEDLIQALLCVGEAPLSGPITGTSLFASYFTATPLGRLDLQTRLFQFPLSPMIGSRSFASLHPSVRGIIFKQLRSILAAKSPEPAYRHLTPELRLGISEILVGLSG